LNDAFTGAEETSPISMHRLIPSRIPSPSSKSRVSPLRRDNEEASLMIKTALLKHLPFLSDDQTSEAFHIKRYYEDKDFNYVCLAINSKKMLGSRAPSTRDIDILASQK
jgi:hypothetical protein